MPCCLKCKNEFKNYATIDGVKKNISSRKYCLDCSPFGKNLIKLSKRKENNACDLCGKILLSNRRNRCNYCSVKIRRARIKLAGISLLGGKCQECGWDEDPWVLEFHHLKDDKEFSISRKQNISWEKMKLEILKCQLLCSNCHQKKHCLKNNPQFLEAVYDYKGDLKLHKINGF